jgi:hypothetical protein
LSGMKSLEELRFTSSQVSNNGLAVLKDLPNLRILKIACPPKTGTLSDAGLIHLRGLSKLEKLIIVGDWATSGGIAQLEKDHPGCKVVTEDW